MKLLPTTETEIKHAVESFKSKTLQDMKEFQVES